MKEKQDSNLLRSPVCSQNWNYNYNLDFLALTRALWHTTLGQMLGLLASSPLFDRDFCYILFSAKMFPQIGPKDLIWGAINFKAGINQYCIAVLFVSL